MNYYYKHKMSGEYVKFIKQKSGYLYYTKLDGPKGNEFFKLVEIFNDLYKYEPNYKEAKPVDDAYDALRYNTLRYNERDLQSSTSSFKIDHKGNNIHVNEWNKLYCTCDNRIETKVQVLGKVHKVCTNCKKSIIE